VGRIVEVTFGQRLLEVDVGEAADALESIDVPNLSGIRSGIRVW
jgi:hypothetical protein